MIELAVAQNLSNKFANEHDGMKQRMAQSAAEAALFSASAARAAIEAAAGDDEELPFVVPFDVSQYDGHILATSSDGGALTGAVAYYRSDEEKIYLGLAANAGFVGFGMNSKSPSMRHADIVVCREYQAGMVTAVDYHAEGNAAPQLDVAQDWTTIEGGREQPTRASMPAEACDAGWTFGANRCFKVVKSFKTWAEARADCEAEGAMLARIESAEEQGILEGMMPSDELEGFWIGASEVGRPEGDYAWTDGTQLTFTNWAGDAPEDSTEITGSGSDHECAFMNQWSKKWNVGHCTSTTWRYRAYTMRPMSYACSKVVQEGMPSLTLADSNDRPVTWCEISRPRTTCEASNDQQLNDLSYTLFGLLAWSQPSATTDALVYHGVTQRRVKTFAFVEDALSGGSEGGGSFIPDDTQSFTIEAPPMYVPTASGSYGCSYHTLPISAAQTFHIVNFKARMDHTSPSSVAGLQHHIDMNRCSEPISWATDGQILDCSYAMQACSEVWLTGGAMYGTSGDTLPDDSGIPIGKDGTMHVVISRHFYNPTGIADKLDRGSHFILTYTPTLRPNEWSTLMLSTSAILIPANTYSHVTQSYCPSECTQRLKEPSEVRAVGMHMHGHAKKGLIRLVRGSQELEPLAVIDPWDQAAAGYQVRREILPGDIIIMECHYDNDLDHDITYGEDIDQEMCVGTLSLIGKGSMRSCVDMPWGLPGEPVPQCYDHNGNLWPAPGCDWSAPRTFCPDNDHPQGSSTSTVLAQAAYDAEFKEFVPPEQHCTGDKRVFVPAVPGSCHVASVAPISSASPAFSSSEAEASAAGASASAAAAGAAANGDAMFHTGSAVPGSIRTDESVGSFMTSAAMDPQVIVGERDCGMGDTAFKVSWRTDCAARRITFEMEANGGTSGWLAFGLIDAGTSNETVNMPSTRMRADIVQGKVEGGGSIKDAYGVDYVTPRAKAVPVATFEEALTSNGKSIIKFSRPFDSSDQHGLDLVEDRFVFMICGMRYTSSDFDAKHQRSHASLTRFSLFGGVAESWTFADGSAVPSGESESEPEPEPEAEPEAESEAES